jgi:hypothetical protein
MASNVSPVAGAEFDGRQDVAASGGDQPAPSRCGVVAPRRTAAPDPTVEAHHGHRYSGRVPLAPVVAGGVVYECPAGRARQPHDGAVAAEFGRSTFVTHPDITGQVTVFDAIGGAVVSVECVRPLGAHNRSSRPPALVSYVMFLAPPVGGFAEPPALNQLS